MFDATLNVGQRHRWRANIDPAFVQSIVRVLIVNLAGEDAVYIKTGFTTSQYMVSTCLGYCPEDTCTSNSYQPLWLRCWRGHISRGFFTFLVTFDQEYIYRTCHIDFIFNMFVCVSVRPAVLPPPPRLTSCLLKKQARHQSDVCTPSSDCLVVYNQFVTLKKCMAATVNKF